MVNAATGPGQCHSYLSGCRTTGKGGGVACRVPRRRWGRPRLDGERLWTRAVEVPSVRRRPGAGAQAKPSQEGLGQSLREPMEGQGLEGLDGAGVGRAEGESTVVAVQPAGPWQSRQCWSWGHSSRKGRGFAGSPVDLELPIDVTRARACAISPRTSPAATCRYSPHSALTTYGLYGCQTSRLSDCRPPQTRAELNRTKQSRAVNVIVAHLPKGSSFGWLAWCSCLFGQEQPVSPAQPSCPFLCKAIVLGLRTCSCCSSVPSVPLSRATVPVNHHTHTPVAAEPHVT